MLSESIELLALAAAALVIALAFAPAASPRGGLAVKGGVGLAGTAAIAAAPTFDLALLMLMLLAVLQTGLGGKRTVAASLRAPGVAIALLALAALFASVDAGPDILRRFAAAGLGAGLAAALGLLPYLHPFEPDEPATASPMAWLAFVGPVLAVVVIGYAQGLLAADAGAAFGAVLIGLGVVNMAWGNVAAWLTETNSAAWRYSFVADWGLALCGFGLTIADGRRAALLVLFTLVLARLPLYLMSRAPRDRAVTERPINLLVAAALGGSAPFAGFAARVLLLRGATQLFWPLALVLGLGMLLWLPGSLRLGRSLGLPRRRQAVGVALVLALNVAAGLYPLPLLLAVRL